MTTETTATNSPLTYLNHFTGRPRLHFNEAGAAAAGAGGAAAGAAGAATAWHTGVQPEVLGFWQNKGLPLDDPKAFGVKLTELYQNAEKFIGVPPDQVLKLPKPDAKPEEISAFRQRLGVPADSKDYDFSSIKDASGQPINAALDAAVRASLHEAGVPKDGAAKVAAAMVKHLDSVKTTEATIFDGKLAAERATLEKNWGGKDSATYQFNHLQAIEGARRLGITPEAVAALEKQIGYASVMDSMRKIGAARSEDVFVTPPGGGGQGQITTQAGAIARKAELLADKAWGARLTAGDAEARREYDRLNALILGETA